MKHYLRIFFGILTSVVFCMYSAVAYWEEVQNIPSPYNTNYWLDAFFLPSNPNYGWVCGYNGMVIRTTDGGNTWQGSRVSAQADHLESVCFVNQNVGYASGVPGIFRTNDGGRTWTNITVPAMPDRLWGCYFLTENVGMAVGGGCDNLGQSFFRTTDAGQTWSEFRTNMPNSGMTDVEIYSENGLGYAVGSGYLYVTNNGGVTWDVFASTELTPSNNRWHEEITHIGSSFLLPYSGNMCSGGGGTGGMYFTTNNGQTWNRYSLNASMFGTFLIDDHTGWACGYYGNVFYTSDAGATWTKRNCGIDPTRHLDDIWFISPTNGWVVGNGVFHLVADRKAMSKDSIRFKSVCYPGSKFDSVTFYNQSFSAVSVHALVSGTNRNEFYLDKPDAGDIIEVAPCDSTTFVVEFAPLSVGEKTAQLDVYAGQDEQHYTVSLYAYASGSTAEVSNDSIVFDHAYCNIPICDTLDWTARMQDEYIDSVAVIDGTECQNISVDPIANVHIGTNPYHQSICLNAIDTGFYQTQYDVYLSPCNKSRKINVKAYAVSSIINGRGDSVVLVCPPDVGETTKLKLPVWNTGNEVLRIDDVQLSNSNFYFAGFISDSSKVEQEFPVFIEIGKTDTLVLEEILPKNMSLDTCSVFIYNNDSTKTEGDKNPFVLNAQVSSEYGTIDVTRIDYPDSVFCYGESLVVNFWLHNPSDNFCVFSVASYSQNCRIRQLAPEGAGFARIKAGDSVLYTIEIYTPYPGGNFKVNIWFRPSGCEPFATDSIKLSGFIKTVNMSASVSSLQLQLQTGETDSLEFDVDIKANTSVTLDSAWLKHLPAGIVFDYEPKNLLVESDTVVHFKVYFTSSIDTSYTDTLVLSFSGICNKSINLVTKLSSVSSRLLIEDVAGFRSSECRADTVFMDVNIKNYGTAEDNITQLRITPESSAYFIAEAPELPVVISPDEVLTFKVGFFAQDTGQTLADLEVYSEKMNGKYLTAPLIAYYAKTDLLLQSDADHDFGKKEHCEDAVSDTVRIANNGNLLATVKGKFASGDNGFSLAENNKDIPGFSSAEFVYQFNPAEMKYGNVYDTLMLIDETCGDTVLVPVAYFGVRTETELSKNKIDFGEVWPGNVYSDTVYVTNNSNIPLTVKTLELQNTGEKDYTGDIRITGIAVGDMLAVDERRTVVFSIQTAETVGDEKTEIAAKLVLNYDNVCPQEDVVNIGGFVPDEKYSVNIATEKYLKLPNEEFNINIINLDPPEHATVVDSVLFRLEYDRRLAHCEKAVYDTSEVEMTELSNGFTFMLRGADAEKFINTASDTVKIPAMAMLALPDSCELDITGTEIYSSKKIFPTYENGILRIYGYCSGSAQYGSYELFNISAKIISDKDNVVMLEITSDGSAVLSAEIYNMNGAKVAGENFAVSGNCTRSLSAGGQLPSGVYLVRISLYGRVLTEKTIIITK